MPSGDMPDGRHTPAADERPSPQPEVIEWDTLRTGSPSRVTGGTLVDSLELSDDHTLTEHLLRGSVDTDAVETRAEMWADVSAERHVVGLVDWQIDERVRLVTEHMDGGTLRNRLEDRDTVIWPDEAVWITASLCSALESAHESGMTHLGLDPSTVAFRETATGSWSLPKLGGWLLERLRSHAAGIDDERPAYVAPEQFDPDQFGEPDERTDVYRLGIICYELLAGRAPFTGSGYDILRAKTTGESIVPPSAHRPIVPDAVDTVVERALEADPDNRYQSVTALADALATLDIPDGTASATTDGGVRQYAGGPAHRGLTDGFLNESTQDEQVWQTRIEAGIDTSPSVGYGTVYVGDVDGTVTALHADTGTPRWQTTLEEIVDDPQERSFGSESAYTVKSQPAVGQGCVCVATNSAVIALEASTGAKRWERDCNIDAGVPTLVERTLYVPTWDDTLYALDVESGQTIWEADIVDGLSREPVAAAVDDGTVAINTDLGIQTLDANSGDKRRSFPIDDARPPSIANGIIYTGDDDTLYALNATDCSCEWRVDIEYGLMGPPAVDSDIVYATIDDDWGGVAAFDPATGEERWRYDLETKDFERLPLSNGAVTDDAIVLLLKTLPVSSEDTEEIAVIDAETGDEQWRHAIGDRTHGPPAIADDRLILGNDEYDVVAHSLADTLAGGDETVDTDETGPGTEMRTGRAGDQAVSQETGAEGERQQVKIDWNDAQQLVDLLEKQSNNEMDREKVPDALGWSRGKTKSVYRDLKANGLVNMTDWGEIVLLDSPDR